VEENRIHVYVNPYVCVYRKTPVLGKHTKKIKCGCWSKQDLLALASEDRSLTVSNADGDTVRTFSVQGDPSDVQFSEMKADERSSLGETTVSRSCSISRSSVVTRQQQQQCMIADCSIWQQPV